MLKLSKLSAGAEEETEEKVWPKNEKEAENRFELDRTRSRLL